MAFIPQEDEDSQESGMNVLATAGQPQTQQLQQNNQQDQQITSGAPTTIGAGQTPLGSQTAPASSGTRKQKGSGMFTDVRKYIQANKPAAQNISGAITGKAGQQAQQIRSQIENQQKKFQQSLAQNQANLQQSRQFAQEAVQKAGSGQLFEQDYGKFYDIISGQQKFNAPEASKFMQERARTGALERLARGAGREQGRQELLRQTFSGRAQPYTRGQRSLDTLILAGDPNAASQIASGVQQQAQGTTEALRQARTQQLQNLRGFTGDVEQLRTGAREQLTGAQEQLQQNIQSELERRRGELTTQQQALQDAISRGELTREMLDPFITQDTMDKAAQAYNERLKRLEDVYLGGPAIQRMFGHATTSNLENARAMMDNKNFLVEETPLSEVINRISSGQLTDHEKKFGLGSFGVLAAVKDLADQYGVSESEINRALQTGTIDQEELNAATQRAKQEAIQRGTYRATAGESGLQDQARQQLSRQGLERQMSALRELARQQQRLSGGELVDRFIQEANRQRRQDLGQFLTQVSPDAITKEMVYTPEQVARQQALARLAGQAAPTIRRQQMISDPGEVDIVGALRKLQAKGFR